MIVMIKQIQGSETPPLAFGLGVFTIIYPNQSPPKVAVLDRKSYPFRKRSSLRVCFGAIKKLPKTRQPVALGSLPGGECKR